METIRLRIGFSALLTLAALAAAGDATLPLPADALVIEAETFAAENGTWAPRDHYTGWYHGMPSGRKLLDGHRREMGDAAAVIDLPRAGAHHAWVRYLDLERLPEGSGFLVAALAGKRVLAEKKFNTASLRATPAGKARWGSGYAQFVWDRLAFDAAAGPVTLRVRKIHDRAVTHAGGRQLDVFVVTDDLDYEPRITDLHPLFLRATMLDGQPHPAALHIFGRRSMAPVLPPHLNLNCAGLFEGSNRGAGDMKEAWLGAGDKSPWVRISDYLDYYGANNLDFHTLRNYTGPAETSAAFEIALSRAPGEEGLIRRETRRGEGDGLILSINLVTGDIVSDQEGSERSLAYAKAAPDIPGRRPERFPFATGMALNRNRVMGEHVRRELDALALIGINGFNSRAKTTPDPRFPWHLSQNFYFNLIDGCLGRPRHDRIDASFKKAAEYLADAPPLLVFMTDEPNLSLDHVTQCAFCVETFPAFLKARGIALEGPPTTDRAEGARYYWTARYRNHIMTEMLRAGSRALREHLPGVPGTVDFSCDPLYGNLVERGCDWFEIMDAEALDFGWNEDWAHNSGTFQNAGYQTDIMRAACRKRDLPFGVFNILGGRRPWDIQAKGFMELGRGVRAMHFFNYGPSYAPVSDTNSHRPEIHGAIKGITFPAGMVDGTLVDARPARGDAAQLVSVTGDIWQIGNTRADGGNPFGKERMLLNLLLRHMNYRLDIVAEDDIDGGTLDDYRLLFVTDSHLRREKLEPLAAWVERGGVLYLGAGALAFDENNKPLGLDERLAFKRGELRIEQKAGRAEYELPRLKPFGEVEGVPVIVGVQEIPEPAVAAGKGKVLLIGFFPGLSYMGQSTRVGDLYSVREYPAAHRAYLAGLHLPVRPRLAVNDPRVEANWLQGPGADLFVLANWTGGPREVEVTLEDAPDYRTVTGAGLEIVKQERTDGRLTLAVKVPAGGFIHLEK